MNKLTPEIIQLPDQNFPTIPEELPPVEEIKEIEITCDTQAEYVTDIRKSCKDVLKEIERVRKFLKEPSLEQGKRIDQQAKESAKPWEERVQVANSLLLDWHNSQEEIRKKEAEEARQAELKRLERVKEEELSKVMNGESGDASGLAEVETNIERLENKVTKIVTNTKTPRATAYVKTNWSFEVVDPEKVPREFLIVDTKKLGQYARSMKETANVPGVKFYAKKGIGG